MGALVLAAIIAIAGFGYFATTYKPGGSSSGGSYVSETLSVQITYGPDNITPIYFPANFTIGLGQHVTVQVQNLVNTTHGMALAQPKGTATVNTGPISPMATAVVSFVGSTAGNYTISEPASDCGGGSCTTGSDLVGWYVVSSAP